MATAPQPAEYGLIVDHHQKKKTSSSVVIVVIFLFVSCDGAASDADADAAAVVTMNKQCAYKKKMMTQNELALDEVVLSRAHFAAAVECLAAEEAAEVEAGGRRRLMAAHDIVISVFIIILRRRYRRLHYVRHRCELSAIQTLLYFEGAVHRHVECKPPAQRVQRCQGQRQQAPQDGYVASHPNSQRDHLGGFCRRSA